MIITIILVTLALVFTLAVVVSIQPSTFNISRSTSIDAPATTVFDQVNTLKNWEKWSPWAKVDPAMRQSYEGPEAGAGAKYHWSGNKNIGEGSNTIINSHPSHSVTMELVFVKPFKGTNKVEFTFEPRDNQTFVNWNMSGKNNFVGKAVGLFMNCKKMVGSQFEQGLAALKEVSENENSTTR